MAEPELPTTVAACHDLLREKQATIEQLEEMIGTLQRDLALLKRSMFGHRRERFDDPGQGTLFDMTVVDLESGRTQEGNEGSADASDPDQASLPPAASPGSDDDDSDKRKRRGRQRRVWPEGLIHEKQVRRLPEDEATEQARAEGRCFEKYVGMTFEIRRQELVAIDEYVEVIAVDNADGTETKMLAASPRPRIITCFAGPSLLAALAVHRFADHLPYYRLEEILQRSGLTIDRATQSRWMQRLGLAASPLVDLMRQLALVDDVAQADETPVPKLEPGLRRTSTSYLWAVLGIVRYPYTTYYYTSDRSRAGPDEIFADFSGTLVSDAYICYERLNQATQGRIRMACCHVHARRKFEELHKLGATEATSTALGYFHRLFAIEDQLRPLSAEERHYYRQLHARPVMEQFKTWLDEKLLTLRPKDSLRGAINYMTCRWESFTRFLESGLIPMDNNDSEQAVKSPVMGKKAWLFFGNDNGGKTAATFYTLTATCRRLYIDPLAYLTDVFERLPLIDASSVPALEPLLPDRWLEAHPEARLIEREAEAEQRAARTRRNRVHRRQAMAAQSH